MENNQENNIESRVMGEIASGRVKLRSKYIFIAEKLGLESALALTVVLAIIFFSLVLYYLRASDNMQYLSFGSRGLYAFLESFPYPLVVALLFLVVLAGYIIKNSAVAYHKSFKKVLIGLVAVIVLTGTVVAFTNIAEMIEEEVYANRPAGFIFKPFLKRGLGLGQHHRGVAGVVLAVKDNLMVIQTPEGEHIIDISEINQKDIVVQPGNFIIAIGERRRKMFFVEKMQVIDKEQMPMLMHGIKRHFGPNFGSMSIPPPLPLPILVPVK